VLLVAERQLNGDDFARQLRLQRVERALEAGAFALEPRQCHDPGQVQGGGLAPELFRLHLDSGHGVHRDDGRLGDTQGAAGVAEEVGHARGVDDVDFGFLPLGVGQAGGEGVLAGDLFVVEVGDGRAFVDLAQPVDGAGSEEQGRDQLGLSTPAVTDYSHVADAGGVVDLHRGFPPAERVPGLRGAIWGVRGAGDHSQGGVGLQGDIYV
jgi:hypothetical protein